MKIVADAIIDANRSKDIPPLEDAAFKALSLSDTDKRKIGFGSQMKRANKQDRLSAYECKALKLLSEQTTDFLVWGYFVGIGRPTLDSLVRRGLVETGPSANYPSEIGWRITDDGWRCIYGETMRELLAKPTGTKTYPFLIWKWPIDPAGKRRIFASPLN
jgi:hypothetical protein